MHSVLVLESDSEIANRILTAVHLEGASDVRLVNSLGMAYRILTEQSFDLAIIPSNDASHAARGIKAIRPNLSIVVTTSDMDAKPFTGFEGAFDGVLRIPSLETDIPIVLKRIKWLQAEEGDTTRFVRSGDIEADRRRLQELCQGLNLGVTVLQVILSQGYDVLDAGGHEEDYWAREIAAHVNNTWDGGTRTIQIQYLNTNAFDEPVLLYTCSAAGYLLTLVARRDAPINDLRRQSNWLAKVLTDSAGSLQPAVDPDGVDDRIILPNPIGPGQTFALVLWPIEPLPKALQNIIRTCIERLALENACNLRFLAIKDDHILVQIGNPPGRPSSWTVYLLKNGVQQEIESRFGFSPTLWADGYFAVEAGTRLSESELQLLMKSRS